MIDEMDSPDLRTVMDTLHDFFGWNRAENLNEASSSSQILLMLQHILERPFTAVRIDREGAAFEVPNAQNPFALGKSSNVKVALLLCMYDYIIHIKENRDES